MSAIPLKLAHDSDVAPARADVVNLNSVRARKRVKELLALPFTAKPVTTAELYALSNGDLDPLNPSYDQKKVMDKYGAEGSNAFSKRDEGRIFDLTDEKVDLVETEDGKPVRYNFAVLMNGKVLIGKFYEGAGDDGVKHFQLANGADTKITGQLYVKNGMFFVDNNSATFRFMLFQNYRNFYQDPESGSFVTHADEDNRKMLTEIFETVLGKKVQIGSGYIEKDVIDDFTDKIEATMAKGKELDKLMRGKYEFLKKWRNLTIFDRHVDEEQLEMLRKKDEGRELDSTRFPTVS